MQCLQRFYLVLCEACLLKTRPGGSTPSLNLMVGRDSKISDSSRKGYYCLLGDNWFPLCKTETVLFLQLLRKKFPLKQLLNLLNNGEGALL